jgi:RpiR family carbohydrate utilization transcriptional regulator
MHREADDNEKDLRPDIRDAGGRNIIEIIRTMRAGLRKSDRKVADVVLKDPQRILSATVGETATLAEVSQPTVLRFAMAIGCKGFQDFKIRLAQSLAFGTPATHSVLLDTDDPETVAEKIFEYTMTSLDWARSHLDRVALRKAIDILTQARTIEFFGFGASGIVARDAQQKFPLFGVPCGAQLDPHQQIMIASMMKQGDVAFVISNTGTTRSIIEIARIARENGAAVICMTGSDSALTSYCDVALIVETLENTNMYTPTISRIAALVVIDILSTSVAMRRPLEDQTRIHNMKRQLSDMRKVQPI